MPDPIKVVVTDFLEPDFNWEREQLAQFPHVEYVECQLKHASPGEIAEAIRDAHVIVVNMAPLGTDVINATARCGLIIRHGIGYNNVDTTAATAKGIRVANVPDYCDQEVAEQTVTLAIAVSRAIGQQMKSFAAGVEAGAWQPQMVPKLNSLGKQTMGLFGLGRIGYQVYKRAAAVFGKVIVSDPYLSEEKQKELGITCVAAETILAEADVISLHMPLTDATRHFIDATKMAKMKDGARIVNTSRGGLIDVAALADAIKTGKLAGAAIDVFEQEPPAKDYPLLGIDNVILTPHLGWYSEDSAWTIREKILEDIVRYVEGQPPRFCVNPEVEEVLKAK